MSSASQAVIEAVAAHEGVEPTELTPLLYEVVDCDALDALFNGRPKPAAGWPTVKFTYRGYSILVAGPEDIQVQPRAST